MEANDYVSYQLAVQLKECGFDEPCERQYKEEIPGTEREEWDKEENRNILVVDWDVTPIPTLWQAQKWLRKKGVEVVVEPRFSQYKLIGYDWMCYDDCSGDYALRAPLPFAETYEFALFAGLTAAVKLIKPQ